MSPTIPDPQYFGYQFEATQGTDPIDADTDYYYWGKQLLVEADFPTMAGNVTPRYTANQAPAYMQPTGYFHNGDSFRYIGINGTGFHRALGNFTDLGSNVFRLKTRDYSAGDTQPTYSTRWESGDLRRSLSDCRTDSLTMLHQQQNSVYDNLAFLEKFKGRVYNNPATYNVTKSPVSANSVTDPFKRDANMVVKWDVTLDANDVYSAGGDDLLANDTYREFQVSVINQYAPPNYIAGQNYAYDYKILTSIIQGSISLFQDEAYESMFTDYEAMLAGTDESVLKNAHFKIYNGASTYLQVDLGRVYLLRPSRNMFFKNLGQDGIMTFPFVAGDITVTVKDGLTTTEYGEA